MMMKVLVVDDEPLARSLVIEFLNKMDLNIEITEAANGMQALEKCKQTSYDLLLLDIEMPEKNGLDFLESVETSAKIIFTTAYNEYAVKAFELNATDYLLKPFNFERFKHAFDKAVQSEKTIVDILHSLEGHFSQSSYLDRICVKDGKKIHVLKSENIISISADVDYVHLSTSDGQTYIDSCNLNEFERKLNPSQFIRIHRSTIVNVDFIKEIEMVGHQKMEVLLLNGAIFGVSKSGQKHLKSL